MNEKRKWLTVFFISVIFFGICICSITVYIDPFMHFHAPLTDTYYYEIYTSIQRNVNDGISRNFDYDSIITGTSMTENFMTSEADNIFGENFIKVPFEGARYSEIDGNLRRALKTHPHTKRVIRGIDTLPTYWSSLNSERTDLGTYPYYLNNDNPFDDVKYLLNREVLYKIDFRMLNMRGEGHIPGITSFNKYSNWMYSGFQFGQESVLKAAFEKEEADIFLDSDEEWTITDEEEKILIQNINENIIELATLYPDTEFDYFFTPYSAACWGLWKTSGILEKQIAVEEKIIELVLPYDNIHLYSWNNRFDITGDLNNYKDPWHYAEWINSWILTEINDDSGRITEENYKQYINQLMDLYKYYDYNSLFDQDDYESDYYGAIVLANAYKSLSPLPINMENIDYEWNMETGELSFVIDATSGTAISFCGKKTENSGKSEVSIFDENNNLIRSVDDLPMNPNDDEWHEYVLGLIGIEGMVTIKIGDIKENSRNVIHSQDFYYKDFMLY